MEVIAAAAVIVVLCIILGVSADVMITAALILTVLLFYSMAVLFTVAIIGAVRAEKKEAVFSKVEKDENKRFRTAYYIIGDTEYPCIFPSEPKMMYKKEKNCKILLNKKWRKVYDRFALTTCALGFAVSLCLSAGITALALFFFL